MTKIELVTGRKDPNDNNSPPTPLSDFMLAEDEIVGICPMGELLAIATRRSVFLSRKDGALTVIFSLSKNKPSNGD